MTLSEKINSDLTAAMKAKDTVRLLVLRMAKAAMTHTAIEKKKDVLEDQEVLDVLVKQVKQRRESIEAFDKAGRKDLSDKEKAELAVLEGYLPAQLTTEELQNLVLEAIQASGAKVKADMGKVMSILMPKVKGRADGKVLSSLIQSKLA